jgi:hypothetical protein
VDDINVFFLLWFVDQRDPLTLKRVLEKSLGLLFSMEDADVPFDERKDSFEAEVLGMHIGFQLAEQQSGGYLYRFAGGTSPRFLSLHGHRTSVDGHMARVLKDAGVADIMSRAQFAELRKTQNDSK